MKLASVEFVEQIRLPQLPGGRTITGQTGKIEAGDWLLDLHDTGYVFVAHRDFPEAVTAYSPGIIRLVRLAPPDSRKVK